MCASGVPKVLSVIVPSSSELGIQQPELVIRTFAFNSCKVQILDSKVDFRVGTFGFEVLTHFVGELELVLLAKWQLRISDKERAPPC